MKTDWIFNGISSDPSYLDFIKLLSKDENYTLFKEAFIEQGMLNVFFDTYQRAILVTIFASFVLYALSILVYFSNYLASGSSE